jgi:hypothetical protein
VNRDETLALAEALLEQGIPVVVCKPNPKTGHSDPVTSWRDISVVRCRRLLKRFEFGTDALLMIGGHGIDVIDVDTKNGVSGSIEPFGDFQNYGVTRTPSGGWHYVIPSTGLGKAPLTVDDRPVGDYIGGKANGSGRSGAFLPGSVRPEYGDTMYEMEIPWDVEGAVLSRPDPEVRKKLVAAGLSDGAEQDDDNYVEDDSVPYRDPATEGPSDYAQKVVREELTRLVECDTLGWDGPGWDNTTFEVACRLIRLANSRWSGYSREQAYDDLLRCAPSDDGFGVAAHKAKWASADAAVGGAALKDPNDPRRDFDIVPITDTDPRVWTLDVTNQGETLDVVYRIVGQEGSPLAGLFRRGQDMVYTPRVGEFGYQHPDGKNEDGPVQVRRMDATSFAAYIDKRYTVNKRSASGVFSRTLFPLEVARRAAGSPELMESLRDMTSVSHTPFVRVDGSVCVTPGYDTESRTLYLPDRGLVVPDEHGGLAFLEEEILGGFPWETPHHKANYLGALLTPLLRRLCPHPYPLFAFTAPQPGSGKTLLTDVLRMLHGGVFRAEMVRDAAELRKQITSIMDTTSAPVVTFDNMTGTLKSPILEALLTQKTWHDRLLGISQDREWPNDRLWTITGNNLQMGGDLKRRTVWVSIDPGVPHPERRKGFKHDRLVDWVVDNRGAVLGALLGMIEDWVDAGRPVIPLARTDSYGEWQQTVGSILAHAGVAGTFNHEESEKKTGLEDEDEWGTFLGAVRREFDGEPWLVKDVFAKVEFGDIEPEELPGDVVLKLGRDPIAAGRSLGSWVRNRSGRWTDDGWAVRPAGEVKKTKLWRVVTVDSDLL